MALSSTSQDRFDVFLSFRGKDTRHNIVSHLYKALVDKGIRTFKDDRDIEDGDIILEKFIESSKIVIVVVSEGYPTSSSCLNELQKILELYDQGSLLVLPVFYKVNISDIKSQSGAVEEPFRKLRERYPEEIQAWTSAINELTSILGHQLHDLSDEGEMVEKITTQVQAILLDSNIPSNTSFPLPTKVEDELSDSNVPSNQSSMLTDPLTTTVQAMLSDSDIKSNQNMTLTDPLPTKVSDLVGLDRHMKPLYKLLDLNNSEVRLIGIWGQGGVGKTTLARFAYEDLYNNFHVNIFIDNAENIYYQDPETSLSDETLTSGVQEEPRNRIRGQVSTTMIKSKVGHRNSLLVIDCVANLEQLKPVAEIVSWCGSGSRVILITQDKNLLDQFGVEHFYEVESLRYDEALQLFCLTAFDTEYPPASFESLCLRAVQIANFLPLTLKILGSFLQNMNEEEWEKELQKLEGDREKRIMKIMKKTYKREEL